MPLESTMICLDNSEWMRNGDYIPSRLEAQHDAANLLCGTKTQANPESTVGVLAMAGKSVQVLASPTDNMGTLLSAIHGVKIGGSMKLSNAIQVAQLALKHRRNKTGGQRVVVFIGSPIEEDEKQLTKIGKLLKKNNIAVDVVSMGDMDTNASKLQAFVDAASSNNNSHLVTVPAGVLPSDVLVSSPVLHGDDGGAAAASSSGGGGSDAFAEYGGVDPSMDPELALALRVSMEEELPSPALTSNSTPGTDNLAEHGQTTQNPASASSSATTSGPPPAPASNLPFMDPKFVNSLLSGLPGVDPNDPKIQAAMAQMTKKDEKKDNDENKDDDEKKEDK
ncbi:multiubiquitin chain binding protein mbp1 [Plasmopara halstedii]|uniref:Multiubiquitin chain binding protein mbp1 n=1 Tax=Plasmopara halstedii TaxID=4781 RepID=A0A0P1B661_PLAHL|nr:multiubiquitin chain binding protein mbp1 [Plasmopara halstedii]CEG50310.1 multiubiquitin chain binding protein mbp1 [Plasmopara halstedii]|eukprot:XP_024586679.1 multiubiquitin chain binding protein mbp1 [Plasmopara halstedii]